jgi:hypothetical protein
LNEYGCKAPFREIRGGACFFIETLRQNGILEDGITAAKNDMGSTDGQVYILSVQNEAKYVLKADHTQQISQSEHFLTGTGI